MKHDDNDQDSSVYAGHHSLGIKATQAAAGNHKHTDLLAADTTLDARLDALEAALPNPIPGGNVYKTTAQTILAATSAIVVMDTARKLTGGMLLHASGMLQVPMTGWYNVAGNCMFASSTSSTRRLVGIASSSVAGLPGFSALTGGSLASAQDVANISGFGSAMQVFLNANDLIGVWANTGVNFALDVSQVYMNTLSVTYAGPAT